MHHDLAWKEFREEKKKKKKFVTLKRVPVALLRTLHLRCVFFCLRLPAPPSFRLFPSSPFLLLPLPPIPTHIWSFCLPTEMYVCTCVRRARVLYRTFVCIQISVKRVHTRVTYIGTRGIPVRVRYRRQIGDREYRADPKTDFPEEQRDINAGKKANVLK